MSEQMPDTYHSNLREDIVPFVSKSKRLLDVGGGTGVTARHLKDVGLAEAAGVLDAVAPYDDAALDFASRVDIENHVALAGFLKAHGPFDTILFLDVLEHLVDPWGALDVFSQHVADGGVMIASIPNIRHISVLKNLIFRGEWNYVDAGLLDRTHLRFFVRDTAISLMARTGFTIERVDAAPIYHGKHRILDRISFGALKNFLTLRYYVVARKVGGA